MTALPHATARSLRPTFVPARPGQASRQISIGRLNALLRLHLQPINQVVSLVPSGGSNPQGWLILRWASHLDAFSGYPFRTWLPSAYPWQDNWYTRGSSTSVLSYYFILTLRLQTLLIDSNRPVSRRSEPSSRTTLISEQLNPWDLLQPQDVMSRHRGAKPPRRYGLLGEISLLSPEYLLSVERWPFHAGPPDHFDLLSHLLDLFVSQLSSLMPIHSTLGFQSS